MFYLIAAIGKNRELGKSGDLVWHLSGDLKYFKETTKNHPILMGRSTFFSLPKLLPGRVHYVLTRDKTKLLEKLAEFDSKAASQTNQKVTEPIIPVTDLDSFIKKHQNTDEIIFVIGGAKVYQQLLPYARKLFLTEIDATDQTSDVFFPEFDKSKYQKQVIGKDEDNGISYQFTVYEKPKEPKMI